MGAQEAFVAALAQLLKQQGHGAQKALAEATGYDRAHINRILAFQRRPGIDFQEKIARHYGMSLGEFLRMGESILSGLPWCPFLEKLKGLPREEQAEEIVRLTNEGIGLHGCLVAYHPDGWDEFIAGTITATDFYWRYVRELEALIERVKRL